MKNEILEKMGFWGLRVIPIRFPQLKRNFLLAEANSTKPQDLKVDF